MHWPNTLRPWVLAAGLAAGFAVAPLALFAQPAPNKLPPSLRQVFPSPFQPSRPPEANRFAPAAPSTAAPSTGGPIFRNLNPRRFLPRSRTPATYPLLAAPAPAPGGGSPCVTPMPAAPARSGFASAMPQSKGGSAVDPGMLYTVKPCAGAATATPPASKVQPVR